jgi:hypothetical protein
MLSGYEHCPPSPVPKKQHSLDFMKMVSLKFKRATYPVSEEDIFCKICDSTGHKLGLTKADPRIMAFVWTSNSSLFNTPA